MRKEGESPVNVNFDIDVNKLLSSILGGKSTNSNALVVLVANGTLQPAFVHYSTSDGGHGDLKPAIGDPNITPIDTSKVSETANHFAVGVEPKGEGSNILLQIKLRSSVLNLMCACPTGFHFANYVRYKVTDKLESIKAARDAVSKQEKHYADHGPLELETDDLSISVTLSQASDSAQEFQVFLRQRTPLIVYTD